MEVGVIVGVAEGVGVLVGVGVVVGVCVAVGGMGVGGGVSVIPSEQADSPTNTVSKKEIRLEIFMRIPQTRR